MKKAYERPFAIVNEEISEGVYMASGDSYSANCYSVTAKIHQKPEIGRGDYRIQVDAKHAADDKHHSGKQVLVLSFNMPVTYSSSNGTLESGDGSSTLRIAFSYHNNAHDNIGCGDVIVVADAGLAVTNAKMECNYDCGQH